MATITKEFNQAQSKQDAFRNYAGHSLSFSQRYNRFIDELTFSHFSVISMAILIGSCLGGVTAMFVLMAKLPIWAFGIGLFASLANLVACISQLPTKWVVNLFSLSVIVNLILFVIAILA